MQTLDDLKPGQIYDAHGEIAVIVDVLRSQFTDNIALYVRFVRNVGNARKYDILEITPEKHLGVLEWELVGSDELEKALQKRGATIARELQELVRLAGLSRKMR